MRRGNCYVTCEALYHLLGGIASGWVPHTVRHEGDVHWYLVSTESVVLGSVWHDGSRIVTPAILDPTAQQFSTPPPYHLGRGRGFLTKKPSKRAAALMKAMLWQEVHARSRFAHSESARKSRRSR